MTCPLRLFIDCLDSQGTPVLRNRLSSNVHGFRSPGLTLNAVLGQSGLALGHREGGYSVSRMELIQQIICQGSSTR